ncbi:FecCD family ABC transporter permease [Pseudomonas sp. EpS/L25]|uniref:FecCD family ABC transporter permease n=1 Tax=Pseudomonas sp. EpS/L25 TaxID=1749078 RepID=UPI0007440050|nr:iron ABC transporter permease [Pseudomonas sp. EpS/L25]KUM43012.1 iron-siderophore ABC transporter permease [Pseudomonas sp. EpS/L25]
MTTSLRLLLLALALALTAVLSLSVGARWIGPTSVVAALAQDPSLALDATLVNTTRLTRLLVALVVGANLAVAGALMQAMTRNPLASPGLFGINAGATFALVLGITLLGLSSPESWVLCALLGAAVAGTLVWTLGNQGQARLTPLRIVLAGGALAALFTAFSQALLVINQEGLDSVLFWLAGSVGERNLATATPLLVFSLLALAAAGVLAGQLDVLVAGDDLARGLGQPIGLIRLLAGVLVICLAGGAVALAGNIGFLGLMVPHLLRGLLAGARNEHRWLIPGCALGGALLLVLADSLARVVILPQEVPVGIVTALFGGPFFIHLARRGGRHGR